MSSLDLSRIFFILTRRWELSLPPSAASTCSAYRLSFRLRANWTGPKTCPLKRVLFSRYHIYALYVSFWYRFSDSIRMWLLFFISASLVCEVTIVLVTRFPFGMLWSLLFLFFLLTLVSCSRLVLLSCSFSAWIPERYLFQPSFPWKGHQFPCWWSSKVNYEKKIRQSLVIGWSTYDLSFEFRTGSGRFHTDLFFQHGDLVFQLFDVFVPFKFTFLDPFNSSFLQLDLVGL